MDIDKVQAEWVLGRFPVEQLPEFAAQAIREGFRGPNLREMTKARRPRWMSDELVDGAFRELGRDPITPLQAVERLACFVARRILQEQTAPLDGAQQIATLLRRFDCDDVPEPLRRFRWEQEGGRRALRDREQIVGLAWELLEKDPAP